MLFSAGVKLVLVLAIFQHVRTEEGSKQRRSVLTFPPDSLFQITMGITSTGDLERNNAAIALAFQQNAALPSEPWQQVVGGRAFSIYDHLKEVITRYGFDGLECLGKMICQAAETPFKGGLLEDIVGFVLTPSQHRSLVFNNTNGDDVHFLLKSESLGKNGGNCSSSFPKCSRTPLDIISSFVHF